MRRLLIASGAAAASAGEIPDSVRLLLDAAEEILVVAPTLPTRIDWITSATDQAKVQADRRLHEVLGQLDELGVEAEGATGSDDPLIALEDAIHSFDPDHLLIALRSGQEAGWQEKGLLDRVEERFGIPMTVFRFASSR
jgi:hypothetical protein